MKKTYILIVILIAVLINMRNKPISELTIPEPIFQNVSSYYTTLHFPANWQSDSKLIKIRSWFETEPELISLKNESKFNVYTEGTQIFNDLYEGKVTVPSILIQKANGKVLFAATGNNIPETSEELISKIRKKLPTTGCDDPNCPKCKPKKKSKPIVRPFPQPDPIVPKSNMSYLLALLAGASGRVYQNFNSEENND